MVNIALYDLDNTLYPFSSGVMDAINERISVFVEQRLQVERAQALALRQRYFEQFGTTLAGLQLHHGPVDIEEYLAFVHDITIDQMLVESFELQHALTALPLQKIIFTNSPREHASRVLARLGISHLFEDLIDIRMLEFRAKPQAEAYAAVLARLGVAGEQCVLFEDTPANLKPARAVGMTTVLISPHGATHPDADYIFADAVAATSFFHSHEAIDQIAKPPVTSSTSPLT